MLNQETITPQDAIKIAEFKRGLTPKERQKLLALALPRIFGEYFKIKMCWDFSIMCSEYEIPAFDQEFVKQINLNPSAYVDYK